ncbi:MAG: helix-turn-helix domain-containing protein [Arcicella sp.]|nr:helix-turn-helix domain-containing protein [Arcicella sp.]
MIASKNITNYEGLYGDLNGKYSAEYIFLELIETRSQTFDWVIKPHIHTNLFQVFIVEKGEVSFQEATQNHQVQAPCIFIIPPTHLHGLTYTPDVRGYILSISESMMEDIFKTFSATFQSFTQIHILCHFNEPNSFQKIVEGVKEIEKELFTENIERAAMLKSHLINFFVRLYRMSQEASENIKKDSHSLTYFRKFQRSIKNSEYPKSIPVFASELNITPVHLNRICKNITGKSAVELVHQNLIIEAQKYLLHTSYSVSEIAYILKFEYPNYFAKFFKKYTNKTPTEYRENRGNL